MLQDTGFLLLTFVLSNIWKSEMLLNPGWLTSVFETWCLFEKQTRVPVATEPQNSHTTLLHLRTWNLCPIPHHTTLSEIQVYILNFLSLAYCGQCAFNGICILMSLIELDFPRMEKPLHHLSKCMSHVWQVLKSGPHCPFTQLFDQCRDVVDF